MTVADGVAVGITATVGTMVADLDAEKDEVAEGFGLDEAVEGVAEDFGRR